MAHCRSCGAKIEWAVTTADKRMPLDFGARDDGNIVLEHGVARYVAPGEGDRVSHFSTCPNAKEHRKDG